MGYAVAAFIIVWLAMFVYLGWIALRLRGARLELAVAKELVRERDSSAERS
jgi:hypothetical protein